MMKKKWKKAVVMSSWVVVFILPRIALARGWSLSNVDGFGLPDGSISGIIENLLMWILVIFGILGILGFVISGILYLTAAGQEKQIETAKSAMKWSIVGILVGLIGVVVIQAVDALLSEESFF